MLMNLKIITNEFCYQGMVGCNLFSLFVFCNYVYKYVALNTLLNNLNADVI